MVAEQNDLVTELRCKDHSRHIDVQVIKILQHYYSVTPHFPPPRSPD